MALIVSVAAALRLVVSADAGRRARLRDACAALVQYALLFGFAAVAAAISAHGLIGFARSSMGLQGAWPFLLWAALDGAAGLCAVLLMRRAPRGESALAPRLAVWGLVAASSAFNWAHAPPHPGAREAFALMPLIAATLFEFSLRETRHTAQSGDRRLSGLRWLHPAERIRVHLELAADQSLTAKEAIRRVRVRHAAWSLHRLRQATRQCADATAASAAGSRAARRAEHRAQIALTRVGFADPAVASEVLRLARILSQTLSLAMLDDAEPDAAKRRFAELTGRYPPIGHASSNGLIRRPHAIPVDSAAMNGHAAAEPQRSADSLLVDRAADLISRARQDGVRLSQAGLARELRAQGLTIANERLAWLAAASGLNHADDQS